MAREGRSKMRWQDDGGGARWRGTKMVEEGPDGTPSVFPGGQKGVGVALNFRVLAVAS